MSNNKEGDKQKQGDTIQHTVSHPQFIPKVLKQKVTIRLMDGRPIIGELMAYNNYELLVNIGNGKKMIVFKNAISTLEYEG